MLRDIFEEKTVQVNLLSRTHLHVFILATATLVLSNVSVAEEAAVRPGKGIDVPCCKCIDGRETVIDLSTGIAAWTSPNGAVSVVAGGYPWADSPPAKWVSVNRNAPLGKYTYQLPINIPNCMIPMKVTIEGKGWGDDVLTMALDNAPIGNSTNPAIAEGQVNLGGGVTWPHPGYPAGIVGGFGQANNLTISQTGISGGAGTHMLTAMIDNAMPIHGFLFNGKLVVKCSSGPLTKDGRKD